jgi:hypothetical protein
MWKAVTGAATVFINGIPAHRLSDMGQSCGGTTKLVEGSANVIVGDGGGGSGGGGAGGRSGGCGGSGGAGGDGSGAAGSRGGGASSSSSSSGGRAASRATTRPLPPPAAPPQRGEPRRRAARSDDPDALHWVEVRVVDPDGHPMAGLTVRLTRADNGSAELARTNADGVARWEALPSGDHRIDLFEDHGILEPN